MARSIGNDALSVWPGEIPIQNRYTVGTGGEIFFRALKEHGKLIGTRCSSCNQVYAPARSFCERCFAKLTEEVEVGPRGTLVSYTVCYYDKDRQRLNAPVALGLVQLDGATTVILHNLLEVTDPQNIAIGCNVEAVIKIPENRAGSILDIEGFRLVE
ncbi:MAG TPA: Zn-ribbon domain-containing OB-fold protein [Candidatus Binatia bacterium]